MKKALMIICLAVVLSLSGCGNSAEVSEQAEAAVSLISDITEDTEDSAVTEETETVIDTETQKQEALALVKELYGVYNVFWYGYCDLSPIDGISESVEDVTRTIYGVSSWDEFILKVEEVYGAYVAGSINNNCIEGGNNIEENDGSISFRVSEKAISSINLLNLDETEFTFEENGKINAVVPIYHGASDEEWVGNTTITLEYQDGKLVMTDGNLDPVDVNDGVSVNWIYIGEVDY